MALVYRVIPVPDSKIESDVYEKYGRDICHDDEKTLEKEFYDLGYLEISDVPPYHSTSNPPVKQHHYDDNHPGIPTKSFYLFPQDALSVMLTWHHYNAAVWLCEYNIPDEILKKHLSFGSIRYPDGEVVPEFLIPFEILATLDSTVIETDTSRIIEALKEKHQNNLDTYLKYLETKYPMRLDVQEIKKWVRTEKLNQPGYTEQTFANGLVIKRSFFPSKTITYRSFLTGKYEATNSVHGNISRNGIVDKPYGDLFDKSNGILSEELNVAWKEFEIYRKTNPKDLYSWRQYICERYLMGDEPKQLKLR